MANMESKTTAKEDEAGGSEAGGHDEWNKNVENEPPAESKPSAEHTEKPEA